MKKYVSIDIGGTAIKYGLLNETGEIIRRGKMPTEAYKGGPSILEKAAGIVEEFAETEKIHGICISTAGMVEDRKSVV